MAILSARLTVLVCICAALPFALPPAEAAHIYGNHLVMKNGAAIAGHGNTHRAPDHRALGLPPFLRRDRFHEQNKAQLQHDHHPHDDDHEVPRSVFARSRYRRGTASLSRRSSVYVPGEQGNTYLVSGAPQSSRVRGSTSRGKHSSRAYNRRQVDENNLAIGRVDIMSQSPGNSQRLASLIADSTPIDWSSGQSSAKAFPLNASTTNQTQFVMIVADDGSSSVGSNKHVNIATQVFDANSAEMVMFCATYDPDPGARSALVMTPCSGIAQSSAVDDNTDESCVDDADDASSSSPQESQIFSYDPSTGQIQPISAASSLDTGDSSDDQASCAEVRVRRDAGDTASSSTARPSASSTVSTRSSASSASTSTPPTATPSSQPRNVTLIFVAGVPEVPVSPPIPTNRTFTTFTTTSASTSASQVIVITQTITTTVPPSPTMSPAQGAASSLTSSGRTFTTFTTTSASTSASQVIVITQTITATVAPSPTMSPAQGAASSLTSSATVSPAIPTNGTFTFTTTSASTSASQVIVITQTVTTTVPSSPTVSPAQGAASSPTSSATQSPSISVPSGATTAMATGPSLTPSPSFSRSASAAATPSVPVSVASFEIEIVGVDAPITTGPSSSTAFATTTVSASSSSSIDPLAVASSIANAMLSRRVIAEASASIRR